MDFVSIFLIAIALSMDAFAVAIAQGLSSKGKEFHMAFSFGFFQAFMPVIGWATGMEAKNLISSTSYVASLILLLIGIKMIFEAGEMEKMEITLTAIIILSIATSIDAMAAGVSLSLMGESIILPAIIIGMVTFFVSMSGFFISGRVKRSYMAEIFGGIILIALGLRILLQESM